jgi:hypothetical protein
MQARVVDPRCTTWELNNPVFYVSFFRHDSAHTHVPSQSVSHASEEWELTGGDVQDALAWAKNHAGQDRSWILHVADPSPEGPGLIQLAGIDANAANAPTTVW